MTWEDELQAMAREREAAGGSALSQLAVDHPATLLRELRNYLARQADLRRLTKTYDDAPRLESREKREKGELELVCDEVEFCSGSRLTFNIRLRQEYPGWLVRKFGFHLLFTGRAVGMVRIHLKPSDTFDPLRVPRCHLHIDNSEPHIPFPIMSCRLILHLLCEYIEPNLGTPTSD